MRGERRRWAWATLRHAAPCLIEGTLIPLVIFTTIVHSLGMSPALWASLLWAGLAFGRRVWRGGRISGVLVLTAVGTLFRLVTVVWTASPFVFFLQPVLGTVATGLAFGLSVPLRRPLTARLGADLVPLDPAAWSRPDVRRASSRLALVWSLALFANAGLTLWMLYHFPVATFVLLKPFVGVVTTFPAVIVSFVVGSRVLRRSAGAICLGRSALGRSALGWSAMGRSTLGPEPSEAPEAHAAWPEASLLLSVAS